MDQIIQYLYFGIIAIALFLLLIKPSYVFYVFLGSLPIEALVSSDVFSLPKILGLMALISFLFVAIMTRQKMVFDRPFWIMFILTLWGAASYFWSYDPAQTLIRLSTLLQLLILYFLIVNQIKDSRSIHRMMTSLFIGSALFAAFGLSDLFLLLAQNPNARLASIARNANWYFLVAICLIPAVYWVFAARTKKILKTLALLVMVSLLITSLYTQSRGGLISLGIFFLAYLALTRRKATWFLMIGLIAALVVQLAPEGYWSRFLMIGSDSTDRLRDLWPAGWRAFVNNPWPGYGLGASSSIVPVYVITRWLGPSASVHNAMLAVGLDLGLPGILLYLGFVAQPVLKLLQAIRKSDKGRKHSVLLTAGKLLLAVLVAYLASWFKGGALEYNKMLWLLMGMATVTSSRLLMISNLTHSETAESINVNPNTVYIH